MGVRPRDRVLQIADELFYARGLHAVGIDEIVARSGAAKATLYAHFPTKDDLIAAYLQQRSDDWRAHLTAVLEAQPRTPAESIDAIFQTLADGCGSEGFRGCPFINAAAEYPQPTHPARRIGTEHRRWVRDLLLSFAKAGRWSDPDALADQLSLLYDSAMVGSQLDGHNAPADRAREAARTLVAAAARPRRTPPRERSRRKRR
jgi:AcrR family transcriptional regulator